MFKNRLAVILSCVILASCVSHSYTVDDVVGEYYHSSRVVSTDEGYSLHLSLEENGTCCLENRICISNCSATGIWYVRNDSVICRFGDYAGPDYPFNTLRVDGEMSFGIHGKTLKSKEYGFRRQKPSVRGECREAMLFSLDNGTVNGLYGVPELTTGCNMLADACEIRCVAAAVGDCDGDGNVKDGYGNWFRYYDIPSPPDYRLILRVDDESLEEYIFYTDNYNRVVAQVVARDYGDGADFETMVSLYRNDTIHTTRITGHYIVDEESDTIIDSLPAMCDTVAVKHHFRTCRPFYLCSRQSALELGREAFTVHPKGKPVKCYSMDADNGYKELRFELYPLKEEHNAGNIIEYVHSVGDYLGIIVNNDIVYVRKGCIAVNTRNYNGASLSLYSAPNENSPVICKVGTEQTTPIFDICGSWVYVRMKGDDGKDVYGWLEPLMQCGNPFTTCP